MDATPPAAAGPTSRPSAIRTAPASRPAGIPLVLRRLAIGLAGLALAILAGAACVLSFDDLRGLAVQGQVEPRLAYLYPAGFDALLIVALIGVPLLRSGRLLVRLQVGLILALLLATAAAAAVATATGATFEPRQAAITVALVPWVMLVIGLWLLLVLVKHTQSKRADLNGDNDVEELVPFDEEHSRPVSAAPRTIDPVGVSTDPYPVILPSVRHALPEPHKSAESAAPPDYTPPVPVSTVTETVAPPELAPPLPHDGEPAPAAERPKRPTRWGDLIRPNVGDVLVHPRPGSRTAPELDDDPEATPDDPAFADYSGQSDTQPSKPSTDDDSETPGQTVGTSDQAEDASDQAQTIETSSRTDNAEAPSQAQDDPDVSYWAGTADEISPSAATSDEIGTPEAREASEGDNSAQTIPPIVPLVASDDAASEALSRRYDEAAAQIAERYSGQAQSELDENEESGIDTQPMRKFHDSPDPEHGIDAADPEELNTTARRLHHGEEPPAPPSGRMRSTPLPPT
ncbi:hypothetical protein GCM10009555_060790 [Acrocarpospora macrocephala]|uniref:DUF2637 domain-containing protein n=1 Tax=Acrocarpospora macrocephala TaxID=150177 RepID=A0A5M3WLB8_9ACTN|nr:DUF2637 domain-containing protein [Acrocarpospora macrocephala]GES10055.1 hypothetical protein Amac_036520 [Acrocarpospora macrocephala]